MSLQYRASPSFYHSCSDFKWNAHGESRCPLRGPALSTHNGNSSPDQRCGVSQRWKTHSWIRCALEYKERRRNPLVRPGSDTELPYSSLDQVPALAACARFFARTISSLSRCWASSQEQNRQRWEFFQAPIHQASGCSMARKPSVVAIIDQIMENHWCPSLDDISVYAMLERDGRAHVKLENRKVLQWTHFGYMGTDCRMGGRSDFGTRRSTTVDLSFDMPSFAAG